MCVGVLGVGVVEGVVEECWSESVFECWVCVIV